MHLVVSILPMAWHGGRTTDDACCPKSRGSFRSRLKGQPAVMHPAGETIVPFDEAAAEAAQAWLQAFQAHCSRQPADELFKLFKRDTTVCSSARCSLNHHLHFKHLLLHAACSSLLARSVSDIFCAQVHIVNQANAFCKAAFGTEPGAEAMLRINCTTNIYYRHAAATAPACTRASL